MCLWIWFLSWRYWTATVICSIHLRANSSVTLLDAILLSIVCPFSKLVQEILTLNVFQHDVLLVSLREVVNVLHYKWVVESLVNIALSVELL
jgi:hypothetical protein